jgi:hypothetical protein
MNMVDLNILLLGEELLSMSLDDFVHDSFSLIAVQSKSLSMYIIDYGKNQVIRKLKSKFPIRMKSIFYDIRN